MKVTLIDYTGFGSPSPAHHAETVLIFTKNTRLQMSPGMMEEIDNWPDLKRVKELEYMANTIPSSHEFVHYSFMIEDVTRAFTHQFVRTRNASYAQQTMRVLDVDGWTYGTGPTIKDNPELEKPYKHIMSLISMVYGELIKHGAKIEDARGVLPTNIHTNIAMSCNLRGFVEMVRKRSSPRVQGEYREVLEAMKAEVLRVHPFVQLFINRTFDRAAKDLDVEIQSIEDPEKRTRMMKLADQMRQIEKPE